MYVGGGGGSGGVCVCVTKSGFKAQDFFITSNVK